MVKIRAQLINSRVAASTILEVVISMVIIVFVMGIALMILSNVLRLSLSAKKLKANTLLQQELIEINNDHQFNNRTQEINSWRLVTAFKEYPVGDGALTEADLTILDENNVQIGELKSVLLNETK